MDILNLLSTMRKYGFSDTDIKAVQAQKNQIQHDRTTLTEQISSLKTNRQTTLTSIKEKRARISKLNTELKGLSFFKRKERREKRQELKQARIALEKQEAHLKTIKAKSTMYKENKKKKVYSLSERGASKSQKQLELYTNSVKNQCQAIEKIKQIGLTLRRLKTMQIAKRISIPQALKPQLDILQTYYNSAQKLKPSLETPIKAPSQKYLDIKAALSREIQRAKQEALKLASKDSFPVLHAIPGAASKALGQAAKIFPCVTTTQPHSQRPAHSRT